MLSVVQELEGFVTNNGNNCLEDFLFLGSKKLCDALVASAWNRFHGMINHQVLGLSREQVEEVQTECATVEAFRSYTLRRESLCYRMETARS